jgi:hypothetical protein
VTFELIARGKVRRVRPAKSEGHSKALRIAHRYVRAEFARRFE